METASWKPMAATVSQLASMGGIHEAQRTRWSFDDLNDIEAQSDDDELVCTGEIRDGIFRPTSTARMLTPASTELSKHNGTNNGTCGTVRRLASPIDLEPDERPTKKMKVGSNNTEDRLMMTSSPDIRAGANTRKPPRR